MESGLRCTPEAAQDGCSDGQHAKATGSGRMAGVTGLWTRTSRCPAEGLGNSIRGTPAILVVHRWPGAHYTSTRPADCGPAYSTRCGCAARAWLGLQRCAPGRRCTCAMRAGPHVMLCDRPQVHMCITVRMIRPCYCMNTCAPVNMCAVSHATRRAGGNDVHTRSMLFERRRR